MSGKNVKKLAPAEPAPKAEPAKATQQVVAPAPAVPSTSADDKKTNPLRIGESRIRQYVNALLNGSLVDLINDLRKRMTDYNKMEFRRRRGDINKQDKPESGKKSFSANDYKPLSEADKKKVAAEITAWENNPENARIIADLKMYKKACFTMSHDANNYIICVLHTIARTLYLEALKSTLASNNRSVSLANLCNKDVVNSPVYQLVNSLSAWQMAVVQSSNPDAFKVDENQKREQLFDSYARHIYDTLVDTYEENGKLLFSNLPPKKEEEGVEAKANSKMRLMSNTSNCVSDLLKQFLERFVPKLHLFMSASHDKQVNLRHVVAVFQSMLFDNVSYHEKIVSVSFTKKGKPGKVDKKTGLKSADVPDTTVSEIHRRLEYPNELYRIFESAFEDYCANSNSKPKTTQVMNESVLQQKSYTMQTVPEVNNPPATDATATPAPVKKTRAKKAPVATDATPATATPATATPAQNGSAEKPKRTRKAPAPTTDATATPAQPASTTQTDAPAKKTSRKKADPAPTGTANASAPAPVADTTPATPTPAQNGSAEKPKSTRKTTKA